MSDSGSEDYSSSEDEDYVPSGGEYSEDDVNDLVKEDDDDDEEEKTEKPQQEKPKKKKAQCILARKRKKGGLVLNPEDGGEEKERGAHSAEEDTAGGFAEEKQVMAEEVKKKKEDDLWSSFLSDVGQKAKTPPPATPNTQTPIDVPKISSKSSARDVETGKQEAAPKVTITKVFDFAGEEVRVTQEVDSSSREAQEFIKQQGRDQQTPGPVPPKTTLPTSSGIKRPVGMSSLLGKLGSKKQKISTLEKSKLDWDTFKEQEGIGEELATHNRGKAGYIERKAFLERVDYRQFELERDVRLKNMKP